MNRNRAYSWHCRAILIFFGEEIVDPWHGQRRRSRDLF
jgi:hypothetical protein